MSGTPDRAARDDDGAPARAHGTTPSSAGGTTSPATFTPGAEPWPYLTADVPAVPGTVKRFYEDFVVEEVPLYSPEGEGDHVFFTIEKAGLTTHKAVADIARALGVRPRDIGFAGLKDSRAVTRQTLSVEHVEQERILELELPRIRVLSAVRHRRKLRVGHLAANRFTIRLRDTEPDRLDDVRHVVATLERRGVPNYFGPQRFGTRGDTAEIGRRLIAGDAAGAVSLIAGSPAPSDTGPVLRARELFEAGQYREAAPLWPRAYAGHARLSRAMAREKGDARRALHAVDRRLLRLFVNAYQSWIFNEVLARRIHELDRVVEGDLAYKHDSGGIFLVEDAASEQPRAAAFEISPTGPLPGPEMREAEGEPGRLEAEVLRAHGIALDDFPATGPFRVSGSRRPLRFPLHEPTVEPGHDDAGAYLEFRFTLPPGAYATAVLREICKDRLAEGPEEADGTKDAEAADGAMVTFPHPVPDEATLRSATRDELDSLPFGVLLLDPDGTILDVNEAEARRAGRSRSELIGRDFFRDIAPCADVRDFAGAFRDGARRGELSRTFEFVYTLPTGPTDVIVHLYAAAPGFGYVLATM